MSQLEALITQIIERKKRLDSLREQSPEIAEALALSDEYHGLMNDLREMCNPPAHVSPYITPAYPFWQSPAIYQSNSTKSNLSGATLQIIK